MGHSFVRCGFVSSFALQGNLFRAVGASLLLAFGMALGLPLHAQISNQITRPIDITEARALSGHVPPWVNSHNLVGSVPPDLLLDEMTVVLSRSPEQQLDLENLLTDQQNPASPNYQHWLTPTEFGERFGLSDQDTASVTGWLQSQGLHVNWVSPSRTFIGFRGTAADVGRALGTELRYYAVNGARRISVASDPMLPEALAPVVKAIHGLHTVHAHPLHHAGTGQAAQPEYTNGSGKHYIAPADFATIYDVPANLTGAGVTIGIVGRSRVDIDDITNFKSKTGVTFTFTANNNEVVPPNGTDPGPPLTSKGAYSEDQLEATLDVMRAGSVAPGANLLLVISDDVTNVDGIQVAAQYLVETDPPPAQVMNISFGLCEYDAGASGVTYWDSLFQQAAGEGISVLVSSGDAGASGCDANFASPPPFITAPDSPNYICSSSYATCVGGTEFNDTSNPSLYWNSSSGNNLSSAISYIPEGGWNEPLNASGQTQVASSGGGVSTVIATPIWQKGTGVPAARSGRYTPDVSFSASCHDGYYACFAAAGNDCNPSFEYFCGTSAAAPDMAGVTALLDQKLGKGQGNLNLRLYQLATNVPAVFHDVTVASSGVGNCSVNTPSMCNNSIPGAGGLGGGQAGFMVTAGYDEVTGLGSLDVGNFIVNFAKLTPAITWANPANIVYGTALTSTQLNATTTIGGAWTYSPTAGTVLSAGNGQTLSVFFTPTDTIDYTTAAAQVTINVSKAVPVFSNLTTSQSVAYGTQWVSLGGKLTASTIAVGGGTVTITAGSASTMVTVASDGTFSTVLNIQSLSASTTPYVITYSFPATNNFTAASDSSTTLTIMPFTQTISFTAPVSPVTYGVAPIALDATGGASGNAVSFSVQSGPGSVNGNGNMLTITGAGTVVVAANQAGNANYAPAAQVTRSIVVNQASLTVTANNVAQVYGSPIPMLAYAITGFVNGDTSAVVSGAASLTTTATVNSQVGTYPITFSTESLTAANYTFTYVVSVLEVYNTSQPLALWLSPGNTTMGGAGFTLTVSGANFSPNSVVLWNGAVRATTYVSSTQLTATILAQDVARESTGLVTVANPAPNPGTSPAQPFAVVAATPAATVNGISIALAADGSGNHVLTVMGTDFLLGSVAQWNGAGLTTDYVSPWQVSATITASDYAAQPAAITVNNPAGTSAVFELQTVHSQGDANGGSVVGESAANSAGAGVASQAVGRIPRKRPAHSSAFFQ